KSIANTNMQAQEPNLPDRDERGYGVNISGTKRSSPQRPFEEGTTHALDPLGGVLTNCKSPRKNGKIVGSIAPAAAVEVIERERSVLFTCIHPMQIAMDETDST